MVTLVVEDGSGVDNANAYGALADVNTYHSDRNNTYWAAVATDDLRRACIIRASDFIDKRFKVRFRGYRLTVEQALAWPRLNAYDNDRYSLQGVPPQIFKAMCEYALRAAIYNVLAPDALSLSPSQDMTAADPNAASKSGVIVGPIRMKTERVGPIEESTTYDSTMQQAQLARAGQNSRSAQSNVVNDIYIPQYPEADMLLEELLETTISLTMARG